MNYSDGIKADFNSIRSNIQRNDIINIEIDPTNNDSVSAFDGPDDYFLSVQILFFVFLFLSECDIHIPTNQTGKFKNNANHDFYCLDESVSTPITSLSSTSVPPTLLNFSRLTSYKILRKTVDYAHK